MFQTYQNPSLKKKYYHFQLPENSQGKSNILLQENPKNPTAPATGATEVFLNAAAVTPKAATPLGRFLRLVGYDVIYLLLRG